jgi:hypothetical protein
MISPHRSSIQEGPLQTYNLRDVIGRQYQLRVMWFDPLYVVNGLVYYIEPLVTQMTAQERGIKQPFVVHLAWIEAADKKTVLMAKNLWFLDGDVCIPNKQVPSEWA